MVLYSNQNTKTNAFDTVAENTDNINTPKITIIGAQNDKIILIELNDDESSPEFDKNIGNTVDMGLPPLVIPEPPVLLLLLLLLLLFSITILLYYIDKIKITL